MQNYSPLLTDQYQLAMAYGYWKVGKADQPAIFQLSFRTNPFHGNYTLACGLEDIIRHLQNFSFQEKDLEYLASLTSENGKPVFSEQFLLYLKKITFTCDIDAIPEGNLIFAKEPMLLIKGPLLQCQLLETVLINIMAFSSLVATKASRVYMAARQGSVIEFGLRRAQGPNGGLMASRAAYIGGCEATSNVLAGQTYGIPIKGTMAHSWVMSFASELEAFRAFADVMGSRTILLLDTYNTLDGVKNAIVVGTELRRRKHDLYGVRIDSGNVAKLSKKVRKILDAAGFTNTKILISGDLDEDVISRICKHPTPIDIWGVGTKLVTSYSQPALNMVYKLVAVNDTDDHWQYKVKISDQPEKSSIPGIQQIRRYYSEHRLITDVVYDTELGLSGWPKLQNYTAQDILVPILRNGKLVYKAPAIEAIRAQAIVNVVNFLQFNKGTYKVKLDPKLIELQNRLLTK